ncbi:MAG: hypothetical protein QM713_04710 [Arachnia sp.]
MRRLLPAALAALLLAATPLAARADTPPQVTALCADAPAGCSLRFDPWMREGATYPVVVTGAPGARVEVVVSLATMADGVVTALTPLTKGGEVLVPASGVTRIDLTIPPAPDGLAGGWALVSLGGAEVGDLSEAIGGFVPFGSRTPTLLGDGYGDLKPAGAALDLHLVGTVPGSQFAVDYADDDGRWHDATLDGREGNQPARRPDGVAIVSYQMPRGLTAAPHAFRLRNVTAGTAVATWLATPGTTGTAAPRAAWPAPPPVGERVAGAAVLIAHPTATVTAAAGGIAAAALATVAVGFGIGARRRRLA